MSEMTKRTNRVAWGLTAILSVAVLAGIGWLMFGLLPERQYYRLGIQRGARDATIGEDLSPALQRPGAAALYLGYWSENRTGAEGKEGARLFKKVLSAPPPWQRRYMGAFAKGYQIGHKKVREGHHQTRRPAGPPTSTRSDTGQSR
jgi:hypothetical protein